MLTVHQCFVTLGDPVESTYATRAEAEAAADRLREQIAGMVAEWPVPAVDLDSRGGTAQEADVWDQAREIAEGPRYGIEAGRLVARAAVRVDGREMRWRVYHAREGCAEEYCGEFATQEEAVRHAEKEPAGTPAADWEMHRAARDGVPVPGGGSEAPDAESWHGPAGWHCVVRVTR